MQPTLWGHIEGTINIKWSEYNSYLPQIWIRRNAFWNIVQSSLIPSLDVASTLGSTSKEHSFLRIETHSSIRPVYAPKNSYKETRLIM